MSNVTINQLTNATSIDGIVDLLPIYQNSSASTLSISRNTLLNLTSGPVGLSDVQTLTNKTLTNPTINSGTFSGTFSGTYTLGGTPTFPSNVVITTSVQTLTNKTLTSPTINTPTITTPSVSGGSFSSPAISSGTISSSTLSTSTLTSGTTVTGGMSVTGGLTVDSLSVSGSNVTNGWTGLGASLTYSANNGNKEFVLTTTTNLTSSLSTGMKIQMSRGTTPPTQSASLVSSSSQYASITSPTGITFTSAFTCEAWIYLNSYTGSNEYILIKTDSTIQNGWLFRTGNYGQLGIGYLSGASLTIQESYQSIPLNQWVHVAGVVSSVSSKTIALYINGILVNSATTTSNTTTLTQAGNLCIGASPAPSLYFNGYISEARVWSAAQSQANIQANMAINLVGTETNLVGLWRLNGDWTDRTTNNNTLIASGGASFATSTNPYNAIEYGIITSSNYNSGTGIHTLKVYMGNSNTVPNQTLSNFYISTARLPYGFNGDKGNWTLSSIYTNNISISTPSNNVAYWSTFASAQINIPAGAWRAGFECAVTSVSNGTGLARHVTALSTSTSSWTNYSLTAFWGAPIANAFATHQLYRDTNILLALITPHYFIDTPQDANTGTLYFDASSYRFNVLFAECAYL